MLRVALVGNPNAGKSSVFNQLTGLQQKVGNFPGVTVDRVTGLAELSAQWTVELIDFPGTYSLYPTAKDEKLVVQTLLNPSDENFPDALIYVADVTKLEKHLLLFSQVKDLGLPTVLALNLADVAAQDGLQYDLDKLSRKFGTPVVNISGRTGQGLADLRLALAALLEAPVESNNRGMQYRLSAEESRLATQLQGAFPHLHPYQLVLLGHHYQWLPFLEKPQRSTIEQLLAEIGFQDLPLQVRETMQRYDFFTPIVQQALVRSAKNPSTLTEKLDEILTHRLAGPIIFFGLMLLVFQAIFSWAQIPMDWIDRGFAELGSLLDTHLPQHWFSSLLTAGILPGLSGILVFIPQIAILFFLISLLEEIGYMARAAFMFDRIMQFFGLNGRSIVALISGAACAIPAIMSTRTIGNWKERLITIMVTPFISCSARIPVYTVLITFAVPAQTIGGFFNAQALAFMGLYLFGIAATLLAALVFKWVLQTSETSFLMLELPEYRSPQLRNVALTVWEKVKTFTVEAGRTIMIISLILWVLSSFGTAPRMQQAQAEAQSWAAQNPSARDEYNKVLAAKKLEASYAGQLGQFLEPVIRPLGFDWKIGIALITSFAAREVFVGTMATIYSLGDDDSETSVRQQMALAVDPRTGKKVYTPATSTSLLLFYVLAMQCMSTLAVVARETKSWHWPLIQFTFMTGLAYLVSFLAYQLLA